ncbi:MAG TPA: class I SAM-dependent methyltransferase [Chthoniobacterales bacterium]|nr:class I SAM-dependent methyltransferase [Chthoniobacterales bacterium]
MKLSHEMFRDWQREYLFLSIARFCYLNSVTDGYYFEFGCHKGRTMRLAWEFTGALFNWTYVGFDSFAGLPEIPEIDRSPAWTAGALATSEEEFLAITSEVGMPRERLRTIRGFYDESLTPALAESLLPRKAAVIFVDCDLYSSTVPVLAFAKPFLRPGTVVVFDDWFCFYGDPDRGERRAWGEFRRANPGLRFTEFVQTSEAHAFICLGEEEGAQLDVAI